MVNLIILICLVDLVLVDLAASPQVASANSNQDLHRILEDNLLDLEHKQVDLEEEQAASDNKVDLLSNRILLDSAVVLVRNHLNLNQ